MKPLAFRRSLQEAAGPDLFGLWDVRRDSRLQPTRRTDSLAFRRGRLNLFIEQYGQLINISQAGQTSMREIVSAAMSRIHRDLDGIPIKLYPFTRTAIDNAPAMVVIDPALSAGRPVIAGTGLATQIIAERYKAGESVGDLTRDYERGTEEIEEAIRCELKSAA